MKHGVYVPNCWSYGSVTALTRLAREAEAAGWDGFFIWDHLLIGEDIPLIDSQAALASIAIATSADGPLQRIGSLVTPLARRRPWKVAREVAALQELAEGRLVVGAGLGQPPEYEFSNQELDSPPRRGDALDDALELLHLFWRGERVAWERPEGRGNGDGPRPRVEAPPFLPVPDPVPPVWIAGCIYREPQPAEPADVVLSRDEYKPHVVERTVRQPMRPFRRAARHEGLFPIAMPWDNAAPMTPEEVALSVRLAFPDSGPPPGYEVLTCGRTLGRDAPVPRDALAAYAEAGTTWWLEAPPDLADLDTALDIVRSGPPRA